jgi:pimeloyl-ACP methyl ester carboxylesterase
MTDEDIEAYKYTFSKKDALTSAINYYRNIFTDDGPKKPSKIIETPTLLLWGANDVAFEESLAHSHVDICTDITIKIISDGSHWIQQDCPETVNEYMKQFLKV